MAFPAVFKRKGSAAPRGKDRGITGFNKTDGTTGGSWVARSRLESDIDLNSEVRSIESAGLPGSFTFTADGATYVDQYDRQIAITSDELEDGGKAAVDRISMTYEQESLMSQLGKQFTFENDGSLVFSSEVNNNPMSAVFTPGSPKVDYYLPGQEGDDAALEEAWRLLPGYPGDLAIRARRAAASSETWAASPRNFFNSAEAFDDAYAEEIEAQASKQQAMLGYSPKDAENLKARLDTLKAAGGSFDYLMPKKFAQYFADTEKKHFDASQPGSTFTALKSLDHLLKETFNQRGTLQGDDRDELVALGADPRSFGDDKRYLMVRTPGTLGAVRSADLPDDQVLQVVQKSKGARPVCVATVAEQSKTQIATIVLADNPTMPGTEQAPGLLITAFPGVSTESGSSEKLLEFVGKTITVAEGRKLFGREFSVNTQVR